MKASQQKLKANNFIPALLAYKNWIPKFKTKVVFHYSWQSLIFNGS
jgi:hypothetical protein